MSSDNITGYSLSRHWFDFCVPKISILYHLIGQEIDGKTFNEVMKLISLCRRHRIITGDVAYIFMRIFDDKYQIYCEKGWVKKKQRRIKAISYTSKKEVREAIFDLYGDCCLVCGTNENITLDHIIPVARGGEDSVNNLQPLCASCNSTKGTKIIDFRGIQI